jgi:hypothetical protein
MTNRFRFVPILASAILTTGAGGLLAAGCTGDDNSSSGPSDAASDSTAPDADAGEASPGTDGRADTGSVGEGGDASSSADGDATATPDAAQDATGELDARGDSTVGPDADASAAPDAASGDAIADAGDGAANRDADAGGGDSSTPINAQTFPSALATALCNVISASCALTSDGGVFNWADCYVAQLASGYKGSNTETGLVDGGHVQFNLAQAEACVSDINAAAVSDMNELGSTEATSLFQSCYGAYEGTQPAGSACLGTIECAPGNYCTNVDGIDGGVGTCTALAGDGGACGMFGNLAQGQNVCSYRGAASNGLFCQNITGDAGITETPSSTWTCAPQWANGSECYVNQDCSSLICHLVGSGYECASAGNWANANTCQTYTLPADAGAADAADGG